MLALTLSTLSSPVLATASTNSMQAAYTYLKQHEVNPFYSDAMKTAMAHIDDIDTAVTAFATLGTSEDKATPQWPVSRAPKWFVFSQGALDVVHRDLKTLRPEYLEVGRRAVRRMNDHLASVPLSQPKQGLSGPYRSQSADTAALIQARWAGLISVWSLKLFANLSIKPIFEEAMMSLATVGLMHDDPVIAVAAARALEGEQTSELTKLSEKIAVAMSSHGLLRHGAYAPVAIVTARNILRLAVLRVEEFSPEFIYAISEVASKDRVGELSSQPVDAIMKASMQYLDPQVKKYARSVLKGMIAGIYEDVIESCSKLIKADRKDKLAQPGDPAFFDSHLLIARQALREYAIQLGRMTEATARICDRLGLFEEIAEKINSDRLFLAIIFDVPTATVVSIVKQLKA